MPCSRPPAPWSRDEGLCLPSQGRACNMHALDGKAGLLWPISSCMPLSTWPSHGKSASCIHAPLLGPLPLAWPPMQGCPGSSNRPRAGRMSCCLAMVTVLGSNNSTVQYRVRHHCLLPTLALHRPVPVGRCTIFHAAMETAATIWVLRLRDHVTCMPVTASHQCSHLQGSAVGRVCSCAWPAWGNWRKLAHS